MILCRLRFLGVNTKIGRYHQKQASTEMDFTAIVGLLANFYDAMLPPPGHHATVQLGEEALKYLSSKFYSNIIIVF